ncbi:hypothetical protein [Mesorhizobium sp. M0187]|uniref:helix-turn-helix transcriptional regulator n=1 Tax=Mesorhizobium sp. M0187 TaxID=2956908 RepID=UPI00333A2B3B
MQIQYRTAREVCQRYSCSDMTLWRMIRDKSLRFPPPMILNRRRLWTDEALDNFDAQQRALSPSPAPHQRNLAMRRREEALESW